MNKLLSIICFVFVSTFSWAQTFVADVNIDYSQVQGSNTQVYQTLQRSLKDFINNTNWTTTRLKPHERIEANFNIIIINKTGNEYKASLLVQSRRPVFNSTYYTPMLNLADNNFTFEYSENEQLIFNDRKFSNKNLTDVVAFYIYMILGYDADSFARNGGTEYYKTAQKIAQLGQGTKFSGWSDLDGLQARSLLASNFLKSDANNLRTTIYQYHRSGLDLMAESDMRAKNNLGNALLQLDFYAKGNYQQFYPVDLFISAKKDEITKIFGGGPVSTVNLPQLKEILNTLSPKNRETWNNLKK
ncbi:type IX secretion system protein PorD [Weeksella virosa]|nr:DUF4835 family protein [Weeksella virosa]